MKKLQDAILAPESDYLYVETSGIPNSGKGLHTAIPIFKDEIIARFKGEILTATEAQERVTQNKDQYFIAMLNGTMMDSANTPCFAKYANDARNSSFRNNATITLDENNTVCLIASRKIKQGEEIFCSYGEAYWKKHG